MTSSRLPGKVLKKILGRPMLSLQLERLRRARKLHGVILATSSDPSDDSLEAWSKTEGVPCVRGSLTDVLDRFMTVATLRPADYYVRITGDCPLLEPQLIDAMIDCCIENGHDFVTNTINPTYPDGLDTWVFTSDALRRAWQGARLKSEREHVTLYMINRPDLFESYSYESQRNLSGHRWTVDQPEDFSFVTAVYESLYPRNPCFGLTEILKLLNDRVDIFEINQGINRDEGLQRSLDKDSLVEDSKSRQLL